MVDAVDMTVGDTDTESLATVEDAESNESTDGGGRDGASAFDGDHPDPVEELIEQVPDLQLPHREAFTRGLHSLDEVDLERIFRRRPIIMRSVPEALEGLAALDEPRQKRAWKLFMLLPRLLLHRSSRGGLVKKTELRGNLPQASGTVCWRRVSKDLRRGPIWPDGNADEKRMSS